MGIWCNIDGEVVVHACPDSRAIADRLEGYLGDGVCVEYGEDSLRVEVSFANHCSHLFAVAAERLIDQLGPYALQPAEFKVRIDDEAYPLWIGAEAEVDACRRAALVEAARAAARLLTRPEVDALVKEMQADDFLPPAGQ